MRARPFTPIPLLLLLALAACFPTEPPGLFQVNSTDDLVDASPGDGICETARGNGICTLRAAIQESNALAGANTIVIPAGVYALSLPEPGDGGIAGGDLNITDALKITGAGAASTFIESAASSTRILLIHEGLVMISGVTIRRGSAQSGAGLFVDSAAIVVLDSVVVSGNRAFTAGGGIFNRGNLTLRHSTVSNDTAQGRGGGILSSRGRLTIENSTISDNHATEGAGIRAGTEAVVVVRNSTVSGNQGIPRTGGIYNAGTMSLNNVTVTGNSARQSGAGGSVGPGGVLNGGTLSVANSLIARNTSVGTSPPDCGGTAPINSLGYNLIGDLMGCTLSGTTTGNLTGTDPRLGPLASNGGPTRTHALLSNSPAIDAGHPGSPASGTACLERDQRGQPRSGRCDIGAFEFIPPQGRDGTGGGAG